jgi:2,3-dihydro-2,3-dihydroxybenzoate dehydrogenase
MGETFAGRLAVVTGAASGIGLAVAEHLAEQGAAVAVVDRDEAGVEDVVAKLVAGGGNARGYLVDVADPAAVEAAVASIESTFEPIDILVNVAGLLRIGTIATMADSDWADVFAVNAFGVVHASRSAARRMVQRRRGAIITVGSNAGTVPRMFMAAYGASKAASALFTKCLGLEVAEYGVRCNVVAPGSTDTPMLRATWRDGYGQQSTIDGSLPMYRLGIPLRRIAEPTDIAEAVAYLASDRARHITMQVLCVDGGATLGA